METKKEWIITDWTNAVKFDGKLFESFEDGWDFLLETFPNGDSDRTFDEFFVYHVDDCPKPWGIVR